MPKRLKPVSQKNRYLSYNRYTFKYPERKLNYSDITYLCTMFNLESMQAYIII